MPALTKDQVLSLKRRTTPLELPELPAPLLVAEMSGRAAFRLQKVGADLEERLTIMVADMVVNEDGSRMFSLEEVHSLLGLLSVESSTALLKACTSMQLPGGDSAGNSKPSTSAA